MANSPILHFAGKFRFHMPEYNNDPKLRGEVFDENLRVEDVKGLCGCDPSKYFEFEFFDVTCRGITNGDGTSAGTVDALLGRELQLSGFMVDVSPSAICALIIGAQVDIGGLVSGRMNTATQGDLRLGIRTGFSDETATAWYESTITVSSFGDSSGSPAIGAWMAAGITDLDVIFQLGHYTRLDNGTAQPGDQLTGTVCGIVRPKIDVTEDEAGRRLTGRKVVASFALRDLARNEPLSPIGRMARASEDQEVTRRNEQLDAIYDILAEDRLVCLRVLDLVPFLDRDYTAAGFDHLKVTIENDGQRHEIGFFNNDKESLENAGGVFVFPLPDFDGPLGPISLAVHGIRPEGGEFLLASESEWDVVLEGSRGYYLNSEDRAPATVRVFFNNLPRENVPVICRKAGRNPRSPLVVDVSQPQIVTGADGRATVGIVAGNLEDSPDVFDPVTNTMISGDLPWDRNYGNFLFLEIENPARWIDPPRETIELAVRVLHKADPHSLPADPSFAGHISPLFSYHVRYFPYLHARKAGGGFRQMFDLTDPKEFSANSDEILRRLELDVSDRDKMPRSRDLPSGALECIGKWVNSNQLP